MDTSARNRVLARAVDRLGPNVVAVRLGMTQRALLLFAYGDWPIPDTLWTLVIHESTGLLEVDSPRASQSFSTFQRG